ncbi:MAG: hypothetical protein HOK67_14400 [Deltaproteobacteria bacterium]|nr:hypothetical protein [Deltaproteobacteria bacterium]MBT4642980.1 hypothetical protein [Deltaproteobacteria bacterium]MBT6501086.1 hypothetical protein [Deltaproteobacteria bacterium]
MSISFEKNSYYKLETIGIEIVSVVETLLKQYPISKMFLEVLGRYLLNQIQIGIFSPGAKIIIQGTKGKDLFLICNHQADVIIDTKRILQLQAPILVGDKGIIDRESIRNATILISDQADSLVIKIPMELFIRSFKKKDISDKEFIQEKKIYYHLFLEVQERLFKYSQIQKNLWEEINTGLHSLNTQLIVGTLNRQEEKEWGVKVWRVILKFLRSTFRIAWPDKVPQNIKNLTNILKQLLDKKLSRSAFKGTDQQFTFKRQMVWNAWLKSLSEMLVKVLPSDQLPISIGEIELFNPGIYQMRISNLLKSIEKKFMLKKVQPRNAVHTPALLKATRFFGKGVKKHEFNLNAYTKAVNGQFVFKNPNRIMAQLTQQIAQLTATCENEFNASVSKMQHFLEKIKKLASFENEKSDELQADNKSIEACVTHINQGFKAYHKTTVGHSHVHIGEIRFAKMESPVISDLIKSCGSDYARKQVESANQKLIRILGLSGKSLSDAEIGDLLHFCEAFPDDIISPVQLSRHYWITISPGIILEKAGTPFNTLLPGTLIGGESWDLKEDDDSGLDNSWSLSSPKTKMETGQTYLVGVIPKNKLPWYINSSPLDEEFDKHHLPVLQWLIVQHLSNLVMIEQWRDLFFDRYARISEVVATEKKVLEFEGNKSIVSEQNYDKIKYLVMETLGLNLGKNPRLSSELLSKFIYNRVLEQTKKGFPGLTIEEQGNKAYTLWRFLQSQIVMEVFIKGSGEQIKLEPPKSVFEMIGLVIEQDLKNEGIWKDEAGLDILSSPPAIDLIKILSDANELMPDKKLAFGLGVLRLVENYVVMLSNEASDYLSRLKAISTIKTEFDFKEIQARFISEAIEKLQRAIYEKLPPESRDQQSPINK